MADTVESIMHQCQETERVCPNPQQWNILWELLPDRQRKGGGWSPPAPLILVAWHDTTSLEKMIRFKEHLEWAKSHGALPSVAQYLLSLSEDDWHHLGE